VWQLHRQRRISQFLERYWFGVALLICLLFLSIWPFEQFSEFHDSQRMVSTVLVAIALLISLCATQINVRAIWISTAALTWGLFAVWLSPLPLWSMLELGLLFSVALLGLTLIPRLTELQSKHLLYIFVIIQAFYVVHNLTDYTFVMMTGAKLEPYSLCNGFSNTRFYGQFLTWTMPFTIGALAVNRHYPYRKAIAVLLIIEWAFQFLTLNRSFLVAMAATLPVVWWMTQEHWKRYAKWLLLTAVVGFGLYILMLHVLPGLLGIDVSYAIKFSSGRDVLDSSGRVRLWLDAWQLMMSHPWLGAGPMMTALGSVSKISAHPHNYILQLLAEWGIPFTLLLVGGAVFGSVRLKRLIQKSSTESQLLAVPVVASLSAGAVAGLFDGLLVMPVSLVYMTLVLACCAGLWRNLTPEVERRRFPLWSVPFLISPAVFVAVFAVVNWPHWSTGTDMPKPMSGHGYELKPNLNPRFWLTGQIDLVKK
jgi:putative inorganic carbon (hco3(-)) transporter